MKIFFYELYKMRNRWVLAVLTALLLTISCALYIHSEYKKHESLIKNRAAYEEMEGEVADLSLEEGGVYVVQMLKELEDYSMLSLESDSSSIDLFWAETIEQIKAENPEVVKRYLLSDYVDHPENIYLDTLLYGELDKQFQAHIDHQQYVEEMEAHAKESLSVSIFHDKNSFAHRNIQRTLNDFAPLKTLDYDIGLQYGLVSPTQFKPTDVFILILLFIIVFYLFHQERENGLLRLIYPTKHGQLATVAAKLIVLVLFTFVLTFIFHGAILFIGYHLYGFGDLTRYIQSMPAFKASTNILTTGEFMLLFLILKALANLIIALLIAFLFSLFRHPIPVFLLVVTIIGISFGLYSGIHPNSYMNGLKYLNIIAFLDVFHFIADYRNINVLGFPFSKTSLSYIVGICMIIGFLILTAFSYTRQWNMTTGLSFEKAKQKWSSKQFSMRKFNYIQQHEWYKLLVSGRVWIILAISIGLFIQMMNVPDNRYRQDEARYIEYMNQLSGPLDARKIQFIESEALRFDNLAQEEIENQIALNNQAISEEVYFDKLMELNKLQAAQPAFEIVAEQLDYLQKQQDIFGQDVSFVNQITSDELFQRSKRDILLALTFILLLGIILTALFTRDHQNNAIYLLRTTKHGRGKLFLQQVIIGYLVSTFLLLVVYLPKYFVLHDKFPKLDWAAPIQSIKHFSELPWSVSILQYVIGMILLMFIASLIMVHIVQLIAAMVKRQTISLIIYCAIFLVPLLIAYLGYTQINPYTFNAFFLSSFVLNGANASYLTVFYVSGIIVLGLFVTMFMWKRYISTRSGRG